MTAAVAVFGILVASGVGLRAHAGWARGLALLGFGACAYTSINSLGRPGRVRSC